MATATYADYIARHPDSATPRATVEAFIDDVAAEIAARCLDKGSGYDDLVASRGALVKRIECAAAHRMCPPSPVKGVSQEGLKSFSQTVGDHKWDREYSSGNGNSLLLKSEWNALGLSNQQIGQLDMASIMGV